jgi:hypothetical protein
MKSSNISDATELTKGISRDQVQASIKTTTNLDINININIDIDLLSKNDFR